MKKIDFVFIDRTEKKESIPLCCPVCSYCMRTPEDRKSFVNKKCCYKCAIVFADSRLDEWNDGWRPSSEEIELEIQKRRTMPVSIDLSLLRDS